jgi:phosphatidate cytidylyltransferase
MTSKALTFCLRLSTTVVLWVVILSAILAGYEVGFFLVILGIALAALWEFFGMLKAAGIPHFRLTGMLTAAVFLTGSFWYSRAQGPGAGQEFELAVVVLFLMTVFARQMFRSIHDKEPLATMAYTVFGLLYIPWMFNFLTKLLFLTPRTDLGETTGQYYVLFLILVTKFTDMGAYFFGMLFGRHPMAPHISPKKTWEGFAGAMVGALVGSFGLYALIPERLALFSWGDVAFLGAFLGFAAIVGDLAESIIKRSTQAKDSSHVLPGIGGTLDLVDSILFTAPLLYFYMRLVLGVGS